MSTPSGFDRFLADFRETIVGATARLRDITPEASRHKTAADDWAPIEILGHLVDSAANNHQRFVRAQFTDDLVFPGYEQERWVSSQKYLDESWPDLVQLWSSYNLHLSHVCFSDTRRHHLQSRVRNTLWIKLLLNPCRRISPRHSNT